MNSNLKQKLVISGLIGFFIVILTLENIPNGNNLNSNYQNLTPKTSIISNKIYIDNNWTATKAAGTCTGEGTSSNPYIIEYLEINAQNVGSCIIVQNSTEHFIIRNCTLINSGSAETDAGVQLTNVNNAQIINNTLINNHNGIYIDISLNLIISNNTCSNDRDLRILYSDNALIYLNNFKSTYLNLYLRNTTFSCRSPKKYIYIYHGYTYTNYLGNYWSGYSDDDNNGDGIGDKSHKFYDSTVLQVDYYPLIDLVNNYQIIGISNDTGGFIPGYQLYLLLGIISISSIILLKRKYFDTISEN